MLIKSGFFVLVGIGEEANTILVAGSSRDELRQLIIDALSGDLPGELAGFLAFAIVESRPLFAPPVAVATHQPVATSS